MSPFDDEVEETTQVGVLPPRLADSPALQRKTPHLIVLHSTAQVGKTFKLSGTQILGRKNADIVIEDAGVSRHHARLSVLPSGDGVLVEDLGSTNGTYLNFTRVTRAELHDGDKLQVGNLTVLKLAYQDAFDEEVQKNLYESATRDHLTGLYNKKYLVDVLAKEFAYATRHKVPLSLLMLDIDHFKQVNDTYGHPAGDAVLARVGRRIAEIVRIEDAVARFGGEEFTVLLRETATKDAVICAERIRLGLDATRIQFQSFSLKATVSVGVATLIDGSVTSPEQLLALADAQLYRAKEGGRNRVCS